MLLGKIEKLSIREPLEACLTDSHTTLFNLAEAPVAQTL